MAEIMELLACGGVAAQRAAAVLVADLSAASRTAAAALHAAGANETLMKAQATNVDSIPSYALQKQVWTNVDVMTVCSAMLDHSLSFTIGVTSCT